MKLTKNFNLSEFNCKDFRASPVPEKFYDNVQKLANELQKLRDKLGEPVFIISGYRTIDHNRKIGGAAKSYHLIAKAADIATRTKTPRQLADIIEAMILNKEIKIGGLGVYPSWIHLDIRRNKVRWTEN